MTKRRNVFVLFLLTLTLMLTSCAATIEISMSNRSDESATFAEQHFIYFPKGKKLTGNKIDGKLKLKSGRATLKVTELHTNKVMWEEIWDDSVEKVTFKIPLDEMQVETDYVIELKAENVDNIELKLTSSQRLFEEEAQPRRERNKN